MLSKELNRVISSEKSYEEFDNMFVNVYPDFHHKLNQISKLSQTDLRLASYIKMNHNNNEIAQISGISLRTVESQRYRLSKKLKLDKNQDLNSFLITSHFNIAEFKTIFLSRVFSSSAIGAHLYNDNALGLNGRSL